MNRAPNFAGRSRQRGAVLLFAAMGISALIVTASLIDLGLLYQYRREYQKTADLAALAGAQALSLGCEAAMAAASDSIDQNSGSLRNNREPVVEPGEWRRSASPRFQAGCAEGANAFRVVVSGDPPALLAPMLVDADQGRLSAESIASDSDPVATFSVGSRLAALGGPSVVGDVLKGVGIDPSLDLASYDGLAGVMITPAGLLSALGIPVSANLNVADFNALLAAEEVSLGELLDAAVTVAGQGELLSLNALLLQALRLPLDVSSIDDIAVQIGSDDTVRGLFAAVTLPADAALNVGLDALGLVSTAIQVATSGRGIDVAVDSLGGLGVLLGADLDVKVGVIEPPSIGIGGVGATAYSAQTRVFSHIKLGTSDIPLVGNLLLTLGTSVDVDLPIVIDLAAAKGEVMDLCTAQLKSANHPECPAGEDCADIAVDAKIANICVGNMNPDTLFSTKGSCEVGLTSQPLLSVELLGSNLLSLDTQLHIEAVETDGDAVLADEQAKTVGGELDLGTTISNLTDALLAGLLGQSLSVNPPLSSTQRTQIAEEIWKDVNGDSCPPGSSGRQCRRDQIGPAFDQIESAADGLGGFLGDAVLNPVLGLLDETLSLNLAGILESVGGLLEGVGSLLGNLLGGVLDLVAGNQCTGGGLFNSAGTNSGCITEIEGALSANPSGGSTSNALVVLLGSLLDLLKPILDAVGTQLLMPLLQDVLGLQVGQTDITLMGLECRAGAVLVE